MSKKKRIFADIDEESFDAFKSHCKAMGATMSEVIILGLESGLEKYAMRELEKLDKQKKIFKTFCKNIKLEELK